MKVLVLSSLELFDAVMADAKANNVLVWDHSWIFTEDRTGLDRIYGYNFEDNEAYQKWRKEIEETDVIIYDLKHLFIVPTATDLVKLLLQEAE